MTLLASLVLAAAAFDGAAALEHASRLAALGPHPWGSPRTEYAARYVEAEFRAAGLEEVRQQPFEVGGIRGANVIGVLRAPGPEFVVVGAHHDTAPDAPGAYDDGGGVGILIEAARSLSHRARRSRTIVFVSFDGEEAWATRAGITTGSRAYLKNLGPQSRDIVAALVVEMSGFKQGTPVLQPIPYADPLRPGRYVVTPAWLARAASVSALDAGAPLRVGDPRLSWLYQPVVRTFRVGLYGDDISFLQWGVPATFVTDSSFSAFYPHYHKPSDTADRLDARALERVGRAVVAIVEDLQGVKRGADRDEHWFAGFGRVLGESALWILGFVSLVPSLWRATRAGGAFRGARWLEAPLFVVLLWRNPVPALWVFGLPHLVGGLSVEPGALAVAFVPALALLALGIGAWLRGFLYGLWFAPWEIAVFVMAFVLLWVPARRTRGTSAKKPMRSGRRRGLPRG